MSIKKTFIICKSNNDKMIVLGSKKILKAIHLFKRFQIIDNADSL